MNRISRVLIYLTFLFVAFVSFTNEAQACHCSGCCPPPPPPCAPINLRASEDSYTHVSVNWQPASCGGQVTSFSLFRSANPGSVCGQLLFSNIPNGQFSFIDSSAVPGQLYYYSAVAVGPGGTSVCSNLDIGERLAYQAPNPPSYVDATRGTFADRIIVTWQPPIGGGPYTYFNLYKTENPYIPGCSYGTLFSPLIQSNQFGFVDQTAGVLEGRRFYYSLESVYVAPDGQYRTSQCSNIAEGYAGQVAIYNISGRIYFADGSPVGIAGAIATIGSRSATSDASGNYIITGIAPGTYILDASKQGYVISPANFNNPVPVSHYSLVNLNFTGTCAHGYYRSGNQCVPRPELPATPVNLSASDGTNPNCVDVTWNAAARATGYLLYRSQYVGSLGDQLDGTIPTTSFCDATAVPGVTYFYTVRATNSDGQSGLSNTDPGFRQAPQQQQDCDGDGVTDAQEAIDGTGVCDPGSFQLHLKSPAYTRYNTFLSQWNYLELQATGTQPVNARITAYDINGRVISSRQLSLSPGEQIDTDVNAMVNRANTYGLVRIDFNDQIVGATLNGRLSNYRLDPSGDTFSFAFARELRNPTRGVSYATGNSFDPLGFGNLTPNWAEIVNMELTPQTFTYNLFRQNGTLLTTRRISVPGLAARDIQAGHENGEGVYLAEFRPDNGAANYFGGVARYSSNHRSGGEAQTYNYGFMLEGRQGMADRQFSPISNSTGTCWSQQNWVELSNVRERAVVATITFRDDSGANIGSTAISLARRSQFHFNATALLEKDRIGSVAIVGSEPGSLISQSAVYFHDCQANLLQTAYASQGRIAGRDKQAGTFNTFLGITNILKVIGTSPFASTYQLSVSSQGTVLFDQQQVIAGTQANAFNLSDQSIFGTTPNSYGSLSLQTPLPGQIVAESLRFRETDGKADFAMPTAVQ